MLLGINDDYPWLSEYMIATTAKKKHYYAGFRNRINKTLEEK